MQYVGIFKRCPNCGNFPGGGKYNFCIVFPTEIIGSGYIDITCTHCNYEYKQRKDTCNTKTIYK